MRAMLTTAPGCPPLSATARPTAAGGMGSPGGGDQDRCGVGGLLVPPAAADAAGDPGWSDDPGWPGDPCGGGGHRDQPSGSRAAGSAPPSRSMPPGEPTTTGSASTAATPSRLSLILRHR